ncbi:MAG TPA: hypothetical protein VGI82_11660 [Chitinophagaceae bacterium]
MQKTVGLLLAAAAAYGIYRYSKLSPGQKKDLKNKSMDILNNKMGMRKVFGKKQMA